MSSAPDAEALDAPDPLLRPAWTDLPGETDADPVVRHQPAWPNATGCVDLPL
jgi:hypothetical protein